MSASPLMALGMMTLPSLGTFGGNVATTEQHLWADLDGLNLVETQPEASAAAEVIPEVLVSPETAAMIHPLQPQFSPHVPLSQGQVVPAPPKVATAPRSPQPWQPQPSDRPLPEVRPQRTSSFISTSDLYQKRLLALRLGRSYQAIATQPLPKTTGDARPSYQDWQKLLAQEARAMARGQGSNRVSVMVGDSITQAFPVELLSRHKFWLNQSISGENSAQVLQRLSTFQGVRAESIYFMAGINDLRQGKTDAAILQNIRNSLVRLRRQHPRSVVVLQAILPTRNYGLDNDRIARLNAQLRLLAEEQGAGFLDLHQLFADETGAIRPEYTTDGLHLSRSGYELWQAAIQDAEDWIASNRTLA